MEIRDMVRMANQIAAFYKGYPHDYAVKETADHINRFWEPRMRRAFFDHMAQGRRRVRRVGEGSGRCREAAEGGVRRLDT